MCWLRRGAAFAPRLTCTRAAGRLRADCGARLLGRVVFIELTVLAAFQAGKGSDHLEETIAAWGPPRVLLRPFGRRLRWRLWGYLGCALVWLCGAYSASAAAGGPGGNGYYDGNYYTAGQTGDGVGYIAYYGGSGAGTFGGQGGRVSQRPQQGR